jgi:hypothetical protein
MCTAGGGHDKGWTSLTILGALGLAALAGEAFALIESRTGHPMVALSLFRSGAFSGGIGTMMLWAFGIFGIYFRGRGGARVGGGSGTGRPPVIAPG